MWSKLRKHKKILIIISLIICSIGTLCCKRIRDIGIINKRFIVNMTYDKNQGKAKYINQKNGYIYKYKKCSFFDNDAFASVCRRESSILQIDDNGELYSTSAQVTLFIWPEQNNYT